MLVISATGQTKAGGGGGLLEPEGLFRADVPNIMIACICTVRLDYDITSRSVWEAWVRTSFSFRAMLCCPITK